MPFMNWRPAPFSALCLAAALAWPASALPDYGVESARTAAEISARVREEASRAALRQWQEGRKRAAAHARMPDTMYASTPDPAVTDHPFPTGQVMRRAPPAVANRRLAAGDAAPAASAKEANVQLVWLFLGASEDSGREGFMRVVNHSAQDGEVRIEAVDDEGTMAGPVNLPMGANQAIHLNSRDLEGGNAGKGLPEGIGPGHGDWRLTLSSALDIEALSYVRTQDGFVTTMHDTAPKLDDGSHRVAFLNPGSNNQQESHLRLVNPSADAATVRITGTDDAGQPSESAVTVDVPAGQSRTFTADELESGNAPGLSGALGDGTGKWRLRVESERDIVAMSLLATPTGHLANLSAPPPAPDAKGVHIVPLFLSASNPLERQGFVRVVSRSDTAGTVRIDAFDGSDFAYDPVTLSLGPGQARHFNSTDLEAGNADKGLSGSTGAGRGDWRLELASDLDIEVLAYIRTKDGFVTSMHDLAPSTDGLLHRVAFFNPGSNNQQASHLLLVNRGTEDAETTIEGIDDNGLSPGTTVRVQVPAGKAVSLASKALEEGGDSFEGALGDGKGKWRLWVTSDQPLLVSSLLDTPTGHLANLSAAPGRGAARPDAEAEAFRTLASPTVQSKCVNCHVEGGVSGNTRLVFVTDADVDHLTKNLDAFRSLLESVNEATGDGADYVLGKIQGVSHGGGVQVAAGTDEFADMEQFLGVLEGDGSGPSAGITPTTLFDGVRMEPRRSTLRRAAIVFAGRVPTEEEYASISTGGVASLRSAIRGLMTGPGFHEFLIRASNDRLLTDRDDTVIDGTATDSFVDFSNLYYETVRDHYDASGPDPWRWYMRVQYGIRRAPLELIAHVVENDLPYTDVLTADYIMANPLAAAAYGAPTSLFRDSGDDHEFQPSEILSYYRDDESKVSEFFTNAQNGMQATRVSEPGDLATDYPHAGILNTTVFLLRYPTTATNRNRARSRWTYYHFLGLDVEKSASRTTDPVALADTNNPTMNNPACTVCHTVLDPVAGAFQNYGNEGFYRDQWGGLDSLDHNYKDGGFFAAEQTLEVAPNRQVATMAVFLGGGQERLSLYPRFDPPKAEDDELWWHMAIDHVRLRSADGTVVQHLELQELTAAEHDLCGGEEQPATYYAPWHCDQHIMLDAPSPGDYQVEIALWFNGEDRVGDATERRRLLDVHMEDRFVKTLDLSPTPQVATMAARLGGHPSGKERLSLYPRFDPPRAEDDEFWWHMAIDHVRLHRADGTVVQHVELQDLIEDQNLCGGAEQPGGYYTPWFCDQHVLLDAPAAGDYQVEVALWFNGENRIGDAIERRRTLDLRLGGHVEGDTWYRDMRLPGFDGRRAPNADNSLQWLAQRIVEDGRFAEAAVKFWWPAVMGVEIAEPPEDAGDADFEGRLLAAGAQDAEVQRLAQGFRRGFQGGKAHNLKDLLAEMALSKWFRADAVEDANPVRRAALATAGARRLLTPEELANKTAALTGFDWKRQRGPHWRGPGELLNWTNTNFEYGLLYGGIDSDGITKRGRDLTSVMAGVAKRHAAAASCPVVMKDFYFLADADRVLFRGIDQDVSPASEFSGRFEIKATSWSDRETFQLSGQLAAGSKRVALTFPNDHADDNGDRNVRLFRLDVRDANGVVVASRDLADLQPPQADWGACGARQWNPETGREDHFNLWSTCDPAFAEIEIPSDGTYRVEVIAWADQYGDELARLGVAVESDTQGSAGSRAIRAKLAELHGKLLGVEVDADSEDVRSTYDFFVDVWMRSRDSNNGHFRSTRCDWPEDQHYFDGILDDAWGTNEHGDPDWDWDRVNAHFETIDWSDSHRVARTWTVVLAYLMTDPRYLHL